MHDAPELRAQLEKLNVLWDEMRARAEELARERQELAEFFQLAPEASVITSAAGAITDANRAACELLGAPALELTGKPLSVFISLDRRREFRTRLAALATGERSARWPSVLRPRKGAERAARLHVRAIREPAAGYCWLLQLD